MSVNVFKQYLMYKEACERVINGVAEKSKWIFLVLQSFIQEKTQHLGEKAWKTKRKI